MKKVVLILIFALGVAVLFYCYVWVPKRQKDLKFSKQEAANITAQFVENQTKKKHYQRMQKIYEAIVKQYPNNEVAKKELAKAYYELGRLALEENDLAGAKQQITKALELNPRDPKALELSQKLALF